MCKGIVIANQKGKVDKTTITSCLGMELAKQRKKVVVMDADAQGSLVASLSFIELNQLEVTLVNGLEKTIQNEETEKSYSIVKHNKGIFLEKQQSYVTIFLPEMRTVVSKVQRVWRKQKVGTSNGQTDTGRVSRKGDGRMGGSLKFEYYYGIEAEQFSFYRVPRLLMEDERFKGLSSDAKLLYGMMLDRMSLSMKNGWLDDKNRAYIIYTIDNIREDFGCSKEKAVKIVAELDAGKGIGLIEKIRRGLGKPDIIYVKNFIIKEGKKEPWNTDVSTEVGKTDFQKSENQTLIILTITIQNRTILI